MPTEVTIMRSVPLPTHEMPRGGKGSTLTPDGYPHLANKIRVEGAAEGGDLYLYYKNRVVGCMAWENILMLGGGSIANMLQRKHTRRLERVERIGKPRPHIQGGYVWHVKVNVYRQLSEPDEGGRTKVVTGQKTYTYHALPYVLLAWGVNNLPDTFAFSQQLSHDKRDLRKAAAYALRRQINYYVWKQSESFKEALDRDKLKMPA